MKKMEGKRRGGGGTFFKCCFSQVGATHLLCSAKTGKMVNEVFLELTKGTMNVHVVSGVARVGCLQIRASSGEARVKRPFIDAWSPVDIPRVSAASHGNTSPQACSGKKRRQVIKNLLLRYAHTHA